MTRNHTISRFLSGTIGAVMFLSALPGITVNAVVDTTVLTYDDYEISYAVANEWTGGQNVLITVTNLGDESLYNWAFQYDAGGSIENLYNAVVFDNEDTEYIIKNNGWNFELAPQRSISFGYSMYGDDFSVPSDFQLCSERVDVTEGYEVAVEYIDTWNDGMRGEIIVKNTSEEPLEAWTLALDTNFQIEYVWNGRAVDTVDNHYVVASEAWTQYLEPGDSKSIGFVGTIDPDTEPETFGYALSAVKINRIERSASETEFPVLEDIDLNTDNIDLGYIENLIGTGMITANFDENSQVRMLDGKFTSKPLISAEDAAVILNCAGKLFGDSFHADAADIEEQTDGDEIFYRYSAHVNGVLVEGSQIILSAKDGEVTGLFSTYDKSAESAGTISALSSEEAVDIAFGSFFADYPRKVESVVNVSGLSAAEVLDILRSSFEVTAELMLTMSENNLVWKITLVNRNELTSDTEVDFHDVNDFAKYVFSMTSRVYEICADGENAGEICGKSNSRNNGWVPAEGHGTDLLGDPRSFGIELGVNEENGKSRMHDLNRKITTSKKLYIPHPDDEYFIIESNAVYTSVDSDYSANPKAVSVHANMSDVYDYYKTELGRNSYNNNNADIKLYTDYREYNETSFVYSDYDNACWDPELKAFLFGDTGNATEYEKALDIVGHEFTHAVSGSIVNWYNQDEPGALNEAYSDILGALIEAETNGYSKTDSAFSQYGENANGSPQRDLSDPKSCLDPNGCQYADHYNCISDSTYQAFAELDNGGVHLYSTIFSHAAYLMITDPDTRYIPLDKWARVFYNSLFRLSSGADFQSARNAVLVSAQREYISGAQLEAIENAFEKVGITEPNSIRIVLRWGSRPYDLDSHLTGPAVSGSGRFHTYYVQKNYYQNGTYSNPDQSYDYAAELDYDDTDSFGPEITTIHTLTPGDYYFYVHDFSNRSYSTSKALSASGVNVSIYRGGSDELLKQADGVHYASFKISEEKSATLWEVCKISVDAAGKVTITKRDIYSSESNPANVGR